MPRWLYERAGTVFYNYALNSSLSLVLRYYNAALYSRSFFSSYSLGNLIFLAKRKINVLLIKEKNPSCSQRMPKKYGAGILPYQNQVIFGLHSL